MTESSSELREQLVAYLDGELDQKVTERIERALAADPQLRREVQTLSRTWDLLDELPRVRAGQSFTERTLATMHLEQAPPTTAARMWQVCHRRAARLILWCLALIVSAACGFFLTHRTDAQTEILLEHLPVIENLDLYSEVKDVEFLNELDQSGLFTPGQPPDPD